MYYTYCYLNEEGKPYYIGKGHGNRAYDRNHSVSLPPRDRILILKDNLTEEEAFRHEVYMIAILGRKSQGEGILENIQKGGNQPPRLTHHSEETKSKMRRRRHSEETKRKIGQSSKGRPCKEHIKEHLSELYKGRPLAEDTKKKLSKSLTGIKRSEETRRKMSEAKKNMSEETRRKLSEAAKKRWEKKEGNPLTSI